MSIKAILFDMFDTLMIIKKNHDFYSPSLMRTYRYLYRNGINVLFETFEKAYNKARDELYAKADPNLEEPHFNVRTSLTLKTLGYNYDESSPLVLSASAEFCDEFMKFVYLDEDAEMVLRVLHEKYKLGIISNYAIPECVYKLLKTHGLEKLFEAVVVSAAVNKRKPSPEIFKDTAKELGVSPSETVFVGDTLDADVDGAKSVGMKTVYILRREEKGGHLSPDRTIKRLSELIPVLNDFSND
jgi:putative hydrolase of the HAD superfamily